MNMKGGHLIKNLITKSKTLIILGKPTDAYSSWTLETFDWLNKHHFDYRGLIEKGLAIDATGLEIY